MTMQSGKRNFRNLNRDGVWPDFHTSGLDLDQQGTLRLFPLPVLSGDSEEAAGLPTPAFPAGIAIAPDGTILYTDPEHNRLRRIDACSGEPSAADCVGGHGSFPTEFDRPAGLAVAPQRRALFVADSGNHRVQIFDLDTLTVVDVWTGFQNPTALALDRDENIYIVDADARRVHKFTIYGDIEQQFGDSVVTIAGEPVGVAVAGDRVFVLNAQPPGIHAFLRDGSPLVSFGQGLVNPLGIAAAADSLFVGDNAARRIAVFARNRDGNWEDCGGAAGFQGPVAALAADGKHTLLVHTGGAHHPIKLSLSGAFGASGVVWSKGIAADQLQHRWHRLHAKIEMPAGAHIQFFTFTADAGPAPAVDPAGSTPFAPGWQAHPPDVTDLLLDTPLSRLIWIGAHLTSDGGQATPALSQLRVHFDDASYLPFLPEIYREKASCGDFLLRLLSLYESFFDEVEEDIRGFASIFDPYAIPEENLAWLAGFLALDLPETLGETDKRERIALAYQRYAKRGTLEGLAEELRLSAGVHAIIEEPAQHLGVWSLAAEGSGGQNSVLGLTTMLASSEPQGAVVGRSATLDRSQIISQEEFGAPLFDAVAHRFSVMLYGGEVQCEGRLDGIRAILDREKPAHTTYDLCVLETGMRVGFQCRLGIDTVVGGPAAASPLGKGNLVLAGQEAGRIGISSHIGAGTRL